MSLESTSLIRMSTSSGAAAEMLNSSGDSAYHCRSPFVTSNSSESSPLSSSFARWLPSTHALP